MEQFRNDFAKLAWLSAKCAQKDEKLGLLMLYAAVQHPEKMPNLLPFGYDLVDAPEEVREF